MIEQMNEQQAIAFHDSNAWDPLTLRQRAEFQMSQDLLCMPFEKFHEAVEKTLGRPVFTHEFAFGGRDRMMAELLGERPAPTFDEIFGMLPALTRVLILQP